MPACFLYPHPHPDDFPAALAPVERLAARAPELFPGADSLPDDPRVHGASPLVGPGRPASHTPAFRRNAARAALALPRRLFCRRALGAGTGL